MSTGSRIDKLAELIRECGARPQKRLRSGKNLVVVREGNIAPFPDEAEDLILRCATFVRTFAPAEAENIERVFRERDDHLRGLDAVIAILQGLMEADLETAPDVGWELDAVEMVLRIVERFGQSVETLKIRRKEKKDGKPDPVERVKFEVKDEYDVQYLMGALLRGFFDDVVDEDPLPKHAGKSSRIDWRLKDHGILIEAKYAHDRAGEQERVRKDLALDFEHYRATNLPILIAFTYDPHRKIKDPKVFASDLTGEKGDLFAHVLVVW